ncbi:MAG: hypothetical protein K9L22_07295 [Methylococcaceae bacterium]|nr:hypothetical protein [Methylococcaceae bacterium]
MTVFEGRAAIILYNVLRSLDAPKKFLLPLNICPVVPATFLKAKVPFEFIDISLETLCIDETLLFNKLYANPEIGGILFVKTFGIELNTEKLFRHIKHINSSIFIIDDCCLQTPDFDYDIEQSGADLALFSTGYSKYVDIAWGGFGFLNSTHEYYANDLPFKQDDLTQFTLATQQCINQHCLLEYPNNHWLGAANALYPDIQSYRHAIEQKLPQIQEHKKQLNTIYQQNIPSAYHLGERFNNWRFSIKVTHKAALLKKISAAGLFASSHYQEVDYMYKINPSIDSNAYNSHKNMVNLFNDFRFTANQAFAIVDIVKQHIDS